MLRGWIEQLWSLRTQAMASGDYSAVRAFIQTTFDYQELLDYIAIRNWSQTWDDVVHNHFFYRRASDGKWIIIPQDKDPSLASSGAGIPASHSSSAKRTTSTIDSAGPGSGRLHQRPSAPSSSRVCSSSRRAECSPQPRILPKVNDAAAQFSLTDYQASPAAGNGGFCDFNAELTNLRNFGPCRDKDPPTGSIQRAARPQAAASRASTTRPTPATRPGPSPARCKDHAHRSRIMFDFGTAAPAGG